MNKYLTEKQRHKNIRAKHLIAFRRYVSLGGSAGAVEDYLSMDAFALREHISSQWQPGMNWENYNTFWIVDHIVALKYFDPTDQKQMKLCWHHDNLVPSYYYDNHAKGYCVDVTTKVLNGKPQTVIIKMLIQHISDNKDMFSKYY